MPDQRVFLTPNSARAIKDTVQQVRQVPPDRTVYRGHPSPTVQQFDGIWIYNNTANPLPPYSVQPISSAYLGTDGLGYPQVDYDTSSGTFYDTFLVVGDVDIPPYMLGLAQWPDKPLTVLGFGTAGQSCGPNPAGLIGYLVNGFPGDFFCLGGAVYLYRPVVNLIGITTADLTAQEGTTSYSIAVWEGDDFFFGVELGPAGYTTPPDAVPLLNIPSGEVVTLTKVSSVWLMTPTDCNATCGS